MLTKNEAKTKGKSLLKMMVGKNWKLRVWDNISWHYSVSNLGLSVHPSFESDPKTKFWCILSETPKDFGGSIKWTTNKDFKNPNDAVKHQLSLANYYISYFKKNIIGHIQQIEDNISGKI